MRVMEIKEQLTQLDPQARQDVAIFLRMLALQDDPIRRTVLVRRLKRMRAGREVSQATLRKLLRPSRKVA